MRTGTTISCLVVLSLASAVDIQARTWTSVDGKTVEAELVSAGSDGVTLKRTDGRTFTVPLSRLSRADRTFVGARMKHRTGRPAAAVPEMGVETSKPWVPVPQDVEATLSAAPKLAVENLLEPMQTTRYDGDDNLIWAPNPDGKTWDVIPIYFPWYGGAHTFPIIDLGSGQLKVENHPRGQNWHLCPYVLAPNGKVYISTMRGRRVAICIYDPSTNSLELDAIAVPPHMGGETHPLVRGTDGMLFAGGGHATRAAACVMIDPRDNSVTDFGACGPSHSPTKCYNYSMGADDTHVYIASGKVPWYLLAVDRKTKQTTVLAETATSGGVIWVIQEANGVKASVTKAPGVKKRQYWCHKGELVPQEEPCPWTRRGIDWRAKLPPKPAVDTERAVPVPGQQAEFWVKATVPNMPSEPGRRGWSCFRYDVPLYPMSSSRLIEMPDGRLLGTAGSYTGHFIYDPANGECTYTGATKLSHYATAVHDNKVWLSGYPGSNLFVFDCAGRGTPGSNLRVLGRLGKSRCHKMYGAAVGASGSVYFGGRWMRNGNGGGLGWWENGSEDGLWEPFSNQQITFLCAAGRGQYIVVSTMRMNDLVLKKPTPPEGKLFVFDDSRKEIVREIIVAKGIPGPGPIAWAGGNRVIGWTNHPSEGQKSLLYGVDVAEGKVAWKEALPFRLPVRIGSNQGEPWDFRLGPDGHIWTFMGKDGRTLVRIDPRTAAVRGITHVDIGGRLAFSPPDVYLSGSKFLRRIRGIVEGRSVSGSK